MRKKYKDKYKILSIGILSSVLLAALVFVFVIYKNQEQNLIENQIVYTQSKYISPHSDVYKNYKDLGLDNVLGIRKSRIVRSAPSPTPTPPYPTVAKISVKWGSFLGWSPSSITTFENTIGKKVDYISLFVPWGNASNFPFEMAKYAYDNNKTLIIYWEARDESSTSLNDTKYSYDSILNGKWDTYINGFVQSTRKYNTKIILIPFEEANGDWYPWSGTLNGNSPSKHNSAYRYLKSKFTTNTNVKFGLALNNVSIPNTSENSLDKYYPGDDVVDYAGVDGFNFGDPWESFDKIFGQALSILEKYNRPIIIFSTSSADSSEKPLWIKDIPTQLARHPKVVGFSWFNENKERDWRIWSSAESLKAFQGILP